MQEFEVIGKIKSKERPRAAKIGEHIRVYTPKSTQSYEYKIKKCYIKKYGINPTNNPVSIKINIIFTVPKATSKN